MAFSLRKMLSNINYFKKPEDESRENDNSSEGLKRRRHTSYVSPSDPSNMNFECIEADSTCLTSSLVLPESVKNFAAKKGSLSDTDLFSVNVDKKQKRKKLKLDIQKANDAVRSDESSNVENTPKHFLLQCKSDLFSERIKAFDFNKSFDLEDMSDSDFDIESLPDHSDTDISLVSDDKGAIKMCRKVDAESHSSDECIVPSATPESFEDVEVEKNEEDRIKLLLNYQMKLQKVECLLKKMFTEFQFHVEVSKVFHCRSVMTTLPGTDVSNIPKILGHVTYLDNISHNVSPTGAWNIILEKEDVLTKNKIKKQLNSMKHVIDNFVNIYLKTDNEKPKKYLARGRRSITFDVHKGKRVHKHLRVNDKKKMKHYDFPDFRDAMINLFSLDDKQDIPNVTLSELDQSEEKCTCQCHCNHLSETDSGLISKTNDHSLSAQSITSSIGNFTLDMSTLSAYSESLDQVVSYNSFQDESLYNTLLQKAAIERITFYVQVHSIQLNCDSNETKNVITFYCPSCKIYETDENGLLKHILSQLHCEKIHFVYKTAYIKKCVSAGKEIQPSTVLNPMKMYRDDNKIVCFGDNMYACSLCFENLIVGESVLMKHCSEPQHLDRRNRLCDDLE